jgi:sugar phosphate permease
MRLRAVWMSALVVVCAYCGYKGLDQYSLFAVQAYGMNEVEGAKVSAMVVWARPLSAIGAGLLADRISATRVTSICFVLLMAAYSLFVFVTPTPGFVEIFYVNALVTGVAIYGLRGVYFAIMEETAVPASVTGTAVGLISLVGYTPDIFIGPLAGWLIDRSPGATGHQHFFCVLLGIATVGFITVTMFRRFGKLSPKLTPGPRE